MQHSTVSLIATALLFLPGGSLSVPWKTATFSAAETCESKEMQQSEGMRRLHTVASSFDVQHPCARAEFVRACTAANIGRGDSYYFRVGPDGVKVAALDSLVLPVLLGFLGVLLMAEFGGAWWKYARHGRRRKPRSPANAQYLFYLFLDAKNCDALVGDLEERYKLIHTKFGKRRADFWYWTQALGSVGPIVWACVKRVALKPVLGILAWAVGKNLIGQDSFWGMLVDLWRRIRL